jgi:hypothetical protein
MVIALGFLAPAPVTGQTIVYDDFSSAQLNLGLRWEGSQPEGWRVYEYAVRGADQDELGANGTSNRWDDDLMRHPTFSTVNTSALRRIAGGRLQLRLESAGGTYDDPLVAPGHGRIGATGGRRVSVVRNIVQARVTPMTAEVPTCRGTGESRVRAQLVMEILSSGEEPFGDAFATAPVFATLSLERSSFGGDRITGVLSRCRNRDCDVIEELRSVVFTRTWTPGSAHTLTIRYQPDNDEPANSRLLFTVGGGGVATEQRVMRNAPSGGDNSLGRLFDLRVETMPANCPASGSAPAERVGVTMDARFDNVRVGAP